MLKMSNTRTQIAFPAQAYRACGLADAGTGNVAFAGRRAR
jgi:hypothetical protein